MNELKINAEHELLALHKALMQAKFPKCADIHREVMGSPIISDIMKRIVEILSETDTHSSREDWSNWRNIEREPNFFTNIYNEVLENILFDKFCKTLSREKKTEFVKNCFAPYIIDDETVQTLIDSADKHLKDYPETERKKPDLSSVKIDLSNSHKAIDSIHLHDAVIESMNYDLFKKQLVLVLDCREWEPVIYTMRFGDVRYHEMTGCDFWGGGFNVVCWSCINADDIYEKLKQSEKYIPISFDGCFGIEILFNSGDKLRIVCKSIEVSSEKTE